MCAGTSLSYYLTLAFHVEEASNAFMSVAKESKFLLHILIQTKPEPDKPALSGERETLIIPNSMKRGHNRRSQSGTAFEILTGASIERLQTPR